MDKEEIKKSIARRAGAKGVYFSDEELTLYTDCVLNKKVSNTILSLAVATFAYATIPVKASTAVGYYVKKALYSFGAAGCTSVFCQFITLMSCAPILQKRIREAFDNPQEGATLDRTGDEGKAKEFADFTPSIPSSDFSGPINFGTDLSGSDRQEDSQESGVGAGKKRVTYDDLWRQHKNNSQSRTEPKEFRSDVMDAGSTTESSEPSFGKRKIRTNKYGDPLE